MCIDIVITLILQQTQRHELFCIILSLCGFNFSYTHWQCLCLTVFIEDTYDQFLNVAYCIKSNLFISPRATVSFPESVTMVNVSDPKVYCILFRFVHVTKYFMMNLDNKYLIKWLYLIIFRQYP